MRLWGVGILFLSVALLIPAAGRAQVSKSVSTDKVESILKEMNLNPKKGTGNKPGVEYFDFSTANFQVRLTNHNGKYLWIDALFNDKTTPEEMNKWNRQAKFSRAVILNLNNKETISLEAQLDCQGGVTDGMIRQFVVRF